MNVRTAGFDWDDGNLEKCSKHGVSLIDIERVFRDGPLVLADRGGGLETRFNAISVSDTGRHIFIVFTFRERDGSDLIRPISARFMHAKEVRAYERSRQA